MKIRTENQGLRVELKQLIETTTDLQRQKKRLIRQYHSLLREHQLSRELQRLKGGRKGSGSQGGEREGEGNSFPKNPQSSVH